ncbi:MAG TPA: competence protein ComK [Pseudogracilibacillus sp.]|nr:competence protein ComK [Pseudogracilibacillus sp.]
MLNKNELYTYEISPLTMAVLAIENEDGIINTQIYESEADYLIHKSPVKMIDHACRYFGSSLRGRQDGTKDISGITHKAPISIDPVSGMYFFPTASPRNKNCSWIAHSHIDFIQPTENQMTEVHFKNGHKITLDISYGSMMNQIQRTAQFRYLLNDRIKKLDSYGRNPDDNK